jgi:curved DNA-binding protein CbpA
MFTKVS